MKIRMFRPNALQALKQNAANNVPKYQEGSSDWISEIFEDKTKVFLSKIDDQNVPLIIDGGHSTANDAENAKRLFQAYGKYITPVMAAEERLWASLCHNQYYEYMLHRWPVEVRAKNQTEEGIVKSRYFFGHNIRRSQERNGLARLWLCAYMTYDKSRLDPFELTNVLLRNTNFVMYLLGHSYSGNPMLVQGAVQAIANMEQITGREVAATPLKEVARYFNLISGSMALDSCSVAEFCQIAEKKLREHVVRTTEAEE